MTTVTDEPTGDDVQDVTAKVIAAIENQKDLPKGAVTIDSDFDQLGLDSLDAMEILFDLEEVLDVDVPNEAVRSMENVRQVVDGLVKLKRGEELELPDVDEESSPSAKVDS